MPKRSIAVLSLTLVAGVLQSSSVKAFSAPHSLSVSRAIVHPRQESAPFPRRINNRLWEKTNDEEDTSSPLSTPSENNNVDAIPLTTDDASSIAAGGTQSGNNLPSYRELFVFTATTILIWISEPLLSLVDTTVVGLTQRNAVVQVAALGPATTLIDSLQYLTYFLAMATTTEVAKYLALKDYRKLQQVTSQILGVAGVLGLLITATIWGFGYPLLKTMIGTSQSPELVGLAARYCWIRASVAPLAIMGFVAETNCLANVDTKTPALAVLSASIINIVGDVALSVWGMQGAAVATALATVASTTIMLRRVKKRKEMWRQMELGETTNGDAASMMNGNAGISAVVEGSPTLNVSVNGALEKEYAELEEIVPKSKKTKDGEEIPFLSLPDRASFIELLKLSGPMFFVMLGKIACYSAMSIRATDFGVVNLAAHSIMMRVFFFFTCFGDSLSQATQSFLPKALYPKPIAKDLRKMLKRFFVFSTCVGLFISQSSSWVLSNLGSYLTNDKLVVTTIAKHTKLLSLSLLLHPFIMLTEGTLTATRDFANMISSYTVTMIMHFTLLGFTCSSFQDIWKVLFLFQGTRLTLFGARVLSKVVRKPKDALPQSA
ncbi:Mate efflux family protein [Seminavis robusta]|uniref:Mate efflux family protein n=1 Tax=Seminavis robusta TaxID=568900 RepID=A0A9N8E5V2_9STRA|nr:Mate efflux family protein [Seminavis robusta]|eukprot:Sro529_g160990.1 Mate efflux family protein (605) ;mRNA; r:21806-23708